MNPNWVRDIRDLCYLQRVPFFFTQWGWWSPEMPPGEPCRYFQVDDDEVVFFRANAMLNGNLLDGRRHEDHPFRTQLTSQEKCLAANLAADRGAVGLAG